MLYADDTILYVRGRNINDIQANLQELTKETAKWTNMNKLTINTDKTKTIVFNRQNISNSELDITINNKVLEQVKEY